MEFIKINTRNKRKLKTDLKKQTGRTVLELNELIQSGAFTLLGLHLVVLLGMREKRNYTQHQMAIPMKNRATTGQ